MKSLEESLADVQRVDAKAQSSLDVKKQNLKEETKKKKELMKSMEEVIGLLLMCQRWLCLFSNISEY